MPKFHENTNLMQSHCMPPRCQIKKRLNRQKVPRLVLVYSKWQFCIYWTNKNMAYQTVLDFKDWTFWEKL